MSFKELRKEAQDVRQAFGELRRTARAARKDGHFDDDEKAAIKADLIELVQEVGELLGAGADLVREVTETIKARL